MSVRQRVIDALQHRRPDRTPYDIRFTRAAREKMAAYYGEVDFEAKLGNCLTIVRAAHTRRIAPGLWEDHFGVQWDRSLDADIGVVANRRIAPGRLDAYEFPDPNDPALYAELDSVRPKVRDSLLLVKLSYNLFERAWSLVGMEELLTCMLTDKAFVHELLDRIAEYNLTVIDNVCRGEVDAVYFGDDWGQQRGLIMGPPLWREFIQPRIRRMYQRVKAKGKYVFAHCCGQVQELFGELIECGLDVFNPLQPEVMDVFGVKRAFGDRLSFYGGISTQHSLPFADARQVRDEVRALVDDLGDRGGYIASPAHAIPPDAKCENIAAMIEVLQNQ